MADLSYDSLAESGAAVITGFFSRFIFDILQQTYRDELGFLVVVAAIVFWVQFQQVVTFMLGFLIQYKDDTAWIRTWYKMMRLVALTLVFIWGQYVIALIESQVMAGTMTNGEAVMFVLVLIHMIYTYVTDSDVYRANVKDNGAETNMGLDVGAMSSSSMPLKWTA